MNSSDTPSRIVKAFGVSGLKNVIAVDSSSATDNSGVATFDKGFPPITMQPLSAGGIPPSGKDMNGVLYAVTLQQQWQNAGMSYAFNQDFSEAISGYPKGAVVPNSGYTGQWLNLNEANATPPESPAGASTGWVPLNNYGVTQLIMTSSSLVMSSLQAAKKRIIITGSPTSNLNLIFPSWQSLWMVENKCTGSFSINCKTVSGGGVLVRPGQSVGLYGDGIDILKSFGTASARDVGTAASQIPDMSQFDSLIGSNGYFSLPGGIIVQYGSETFTGNNITFNVQLPKLFPNQLVWAMAVYNGNQGATPDNVFISGGNRSLLTITHAGDNGGGNARWICIGN